METVYIGLGSNLADPIAQIQRAVQALPQLPQSIFVCSSSLYRSAPMGPQDQPDYINAVAEIATSLSPAHLLQELQEIESRHQRDRSAPRWSARTLDLDILLFGQLITSDISLTIPHPGLYERAFVLYPLQEIAPALRIPGLGNIDQLVANCSSEGLSRLSGAVK